MHANLTALEIADAGPVAVLDRGHIHLLDVMGSDDAIASAARASLGNDDLASTPAKDRGLIRRLMRDSHTSPFEMAEIKFHAKAPIMVARQWNRHRMSSWSERSGRYAEMPPDEFYRTAPESWRLQSRDNKQGSAGTLDLKVGDYWGGCHFTEMEARQHREADRSYRQRIEVGIAREQARKDIPLSAYTEWVWKIDLHNLLHFLKLRLAPDAQLEIRLYAQAIATMVERLFPATWEAFVDYRLEAITLSRDEQTAIHAIWTCRDSEVNPADIARNLFGKREAAAFMAKLARLGLVAGEGGRA